MKQKIAPDTSHTSIPTAPPQASPTPSERIAALEKEVKLLRRDLAAANQNKDNTQITQIKSLSAPLSLGGDLNVLLFFFCEVMTPRKLVRSLPSCDKTMHLTQSDCVTLAKGFDYVSKTSGSDGYAVGIFLQKYPFMSSMCERPLS
ncbi:hypothetical protein TrST_g3724 [Triparma strigata]|uniref:Uncharacterized protein n=1 Tax=Triparma strigata TaxID=1606541 RepID=A0A9W7BIJ2_9STRA|nr:hypothetical protein TrST_g3724 [Triparma strigata]